MYSTSNFKQRGAVVNFAVIIGAAGFLLLIIGLFVWSIISAGNAKTTDPQATSTTKEVSSETTDTDTTTLKLADWGVSFTIPASLADNHIKYSKLFVNSNEIYVFTTEEIQSLGGNCTKSHIGNKVAPDAIFRLKEVPNLQATDVLLNQKPMNGYYFVYALGEAYCSTDYDKGIPPSDLEVNDRIGLRAMIKTIQPLK